MKLENISGIGEKTIQYLNNLSIFNARDLAEYYPYKYNIYNPIDINDAPNDTTITITGVIETLPKISYIKRNFNILRFRLISFNKLLNVTIFNRAFMKKNLIVGKNITLIGKYNIEKNTFTASNILFKSINETMIEPIYHLKGSLKNKQINTLILNTLNQNRFENTLPTNVIEKYNFIDEQKALEIIHNPGNLEELKKSKLVLIYKELFEFMFKINYLKLKRSFNIDNIKKSVEKEKIDELINNLPYKLTSDQLNAIDDIISDMISDKRMNRIVIGDVGSGKTIVSFIGIYANYLAGYQSALLAPTEILATQHYKNIKKVLNINVKLLTSSTSKKERKNIIQELKSNKIDCIIGTHSIINEELVFNNLGLVITDEQHRFGVNQRKNLQNKGKNVDVLYMSATPIPRTYALTIYGDMDISEIKTKPGGRKDVITKLYKEQEIKECLIIMLNEIKKGHQIYVISPLVEENDDNSLYDVEKLKEKINVAFNNKVPIEILHGKLKPKEKDNIMNNFKTGITKILISTTVIEVGVDVKNATCITIFNAERFGLSTLHQLRGRVGRNDLLSYCLLISNFEKERLNVLTESTDGFYISERDFELRGSGNLFGTKQSGEMDFKIANITRDIRILKQCNVDSKEFVDSGEYKSNKRYMKIIEKLNFTN